MGTALVAFPGDLDDQRAAGHDDVDLGGNEVRDDGGVLAPLAASGATLDHEVLPRDPACLAQALEERAVVDVGGNGDADPGDLALRLRLGGGRRGEQGQRAEDGTAVHHSMT